MIMQSKQINRWIDKPNTGFLIRIRAEQETVAEVDIKIKKLNYYKSSKVISKDNHSEMNKKETY